MVGGRFYALGIGLACALLSGCASIKGAQDPLVAADLGNTVCPSADQIKDFKAETAADRPYYRDEVIAECIKAVNQHYYKYISDLRQENVSSNLTTDVLALGLSGGATLAKPATAKALSASSALVTGVGTSINKDIFYQQTLPAIVSAMDTRRASVLAEILDSEKNDPQATAYTLTNAGLDIDSYQNAGNIYVAISALTQTAAGEAQKAQTVVADKQVARDVAYTAVKLTTDTATRLKALIDDVKKLNPDTDRAKLDNIARALDVTVVPAASFEMERRDVVTAMTKGLEGGTNTIESLEATLRPKL